MREPFTYGDDKNMARIKKSHKGQIWFYFTNWNLSLLTPAKCGTSTIKQFIWMNEMEEQVQRITHEEVKGKICAVMRDPFSRFCSLWKSKCRDKQNIGNNHVHGMSPNELMDYIEAGGKDIHWAPQAGMIKYLTPTLIPIEHFSDWWEGQGYGELRIFNSTTGIMPYTDELKARIYSYYKEDAELYKRAQDSFDV